jgi:hypothetical protein
VTKCTTYDGGVFLDEPLPITYFLPSIDDDEDDAPPPSVQEMDEDVPSSEISAKRKGKRKADLIDS